MTDEILSDMQAGANAAAARSIAEVQTPMAKAREGGYVEPEPPTRDERVATLIADVEHAMAHNAPMTTAMLTEMKTLLLGEPGDPNVA